MESTFFILIGRSGSGKGTQAELLQTYLKEKGHGSVKHFTTGGNFREFIKGDSYVASISREVNEKGLLQPEFLAIWNWVSIFIQNVKKGDTIILDGAPRRMFEIEILHSALTFMGYTKPVVVYLDVPSMWAIDRLKDRGRDDDKEEEDMLRKMEWFDNDVLEVLSVYKDDPRYQYIHVNGKQDIQQVHEELIAKLETLA